MTNPAPAQGHFNVDVTACRQSFIAREERDRAKRELRRRAALETAINAITSIAPRYPTVRRAYL